LPKTFKSLPKWRNFAKSGHTVQIKFGHIHATLQSVLEKAKDRITKIEKLPKIVEMWKDNSKRAKDSTEGSATRLGDLLDFGQVSKASDNN